MFYYSVGSILLYTLVVVLLMLFTLHTKRILNIFLLIFHTALCSSTSLVEQSFLSGFLAKMVSSRQQPAVEDIRVYVCRLGWLLAVLCGPYVLEVFVAVGVFVVIVVMVMGCWLLRRRETLARPRLLIYWPMTSQFNEAPSDVGEGGNWLFFSFVNSWKLKYLFANSWISTLS